MIDIHGNEIRVRACVYIVDSDNPGSKSKRLLYGRVVAVEGKRCSVKVFENGRVYSKTSATIILPRI